MGAHRDSFALTAPERDAYLRRIGCARAPAVTREAMAALHRAHLEAVPFENLDIHLGVPIELEVGAIVEKIVVRRRGGFCYELNGGFAALLGSLGFTVRLLEARVFGAGGPGIRFDHMALGVTLDGELLADVGFGECFREPLELRAGAETSDASGTYRLADAPGRGLDLFRDGEPQYRLDPSPRRFAEFAAACRHHQTSPESHFTRNTIVSLPHATGRVTLRGTRLIETGAGRRVERDVARGDLGRVLASRFGIELDSAALARLPA
jgi:N-hydroxyarylamine O-acetyltransferase